MRHLATLLTGCLALGCTTSPTPDRTPSGLDPLDHALVEPEVAIADVTGLEAAQVTRVRARTTDDVVAAVRFAREQGLSVGIAGTRHSQGGQAWANGQLLLDMTGMNRVLDIDAGNQTARVEAGATWAGVQDAAHEHGLAVKVQQSSNVFTVGGSLGVNCHGRDIEYGPLISTVLSFRLVDPTGELREVDRKSEPELFRLVIGGLGLFGVVTDVTLALCDNEVYRTVAKELSADRYAAWFEANVRGRSDVGLHYGRLQVRKKRSGVRTEDFLRAMLAVSYVATEERPAGVFELTLDEPAMLKPVFDAARHSDAGKGLRWEAERALSRVPQTLCRNNAMRPPVQFLLDYHSDEDTDILQEYFVPPSSFATFIEALREIVYQHDVNLLNVTVRYVRGDGEAALSYAPEDRFAVVLYVNVDRDDAALDIARTWTRELVDAALSVGGTYYLAYQRWPTREQLRRAYPRFEEVVQRKREWDVEGRFSSDFYRHYGP